MKRIFGRLLLNATRFAAVRLNSDLLRKGYHKLRNWYEGGFPIASADTSYVPAIVQDARFDQNYITRREMLRRMRYWSQNSALVESILSVGERYTVGASGLHVSFYPMDDSSDDAEEGWYDRAELVLAEAFQDFGWNGESMETLLKIGYRCQKIDGDVLFVKTRKRKPLQLGSRRLVLSQPILQIVEGHRIETPFNKWTNEGITTMDGVEFELVQMDGRPLLQRQGFWVRTGFGEFEQNTSWDLLPNDAVFYLRNQHRANQPRSVSDFYAVEQDIHKLEDLLVLEMRAQNSQSKRAVAIKNAAGQLNPLDPKLRAIQTAIGRQSPAGPTESEQVAALERMKQFYERAYGAEVYALKLGEDVVFQSPNRPSDATLNLFELLVNRICSGTKQPRCLVLEKISTQSSRSQGTEVRAQLDSADGYYEGDFQKWRRFVAGAATWFMEWAVKNDPRVADPPAYWRSCLHVQQPKACNVDVAYNAQAATMELASGQTNYDLIYGPRGLSFRREIRKLGRQQRMIERQGVKLSLPALLAGQIPLDGSVTGDGRPEPDDDGAPAPRRRKELAKA